MVTIIFMFVLFITAWLSTDLFVFFPLKILDWLQQGFWYVVLGFSIIFVSWLIGE